MHLCLFTPSNSKKFLQAVVKNQVLKLN